MINTIELFGQKINLRTHYCSLFDEPGYEITDPDINFYVITKNCNANCSFCDYRDYASKWNTKKYEQVLFHIVSKIKIRKIGVSGGEPTLYWDNFVDITNISKELSPNSELSLNTNGFNFKKFFDTELYKKYDSIQISRHHYNDEINNEIFKHQTPTSNDIKSFTEAQTDPHKVQLRCTIVKGFIDSKEEIMKFLDWANSVGINDIGFTTLMPVNEYSKQNFIPFQINDLINENMFLTKKWSRQGNCCECCNLVYLPEDFRGPIRVYNKNTFNPSKIKDTVTFDGKNIRMGFGGDIIKI